MHYYNPFLIFSDGSLSLFTYRKCHRWGLPIIFLERVKGPPFVPPSRREDAPLSGILLNPELDEIDPRFICIFLYFIGAWTGMSLSLTRPLHLGSFFLTIRKKVYYDLADYLVRI